MAKEAQLEEDLFELEGKAKDDSEYLNNVKKIQKYFETMYSPDTDMDNTDVDEMTKAIIDRIDVIPINEKQMRLEIKLKMGGKGDITYIRNGERYGCRSGNISMKMIQSYENSMKNGNMQ